MRKRNCNIIDLKEVVLKNIVFETTRMASPGSFYGRVVCNKYTKNQVASFFSDIFPINDLWNHVVILDKYSEWHLEQTNRLNEVIKDHIRQLPNRTRRIPFPISAKILDTFMHQLMKYERFRYLYNYIFLPLDQKALQRMSLLTINRVKVPEDLRQLAIKYKNEAYSIPYQEYIRIQNMLPILLNKLNQVLPEDYRLNARIELNCVLWQ